MLSLIQGVSSYGEDLNVVQFKHTVILMFLFNPEKNLIVRWHNGHYLPYVVPLL
jgi:hypothetical protein